MSHCCLFQIAYRHTTNSSFPRAVLVASEIGLTFIHLWLGSPSESSSTAHISPFLRLLVPSQSVHMYYHHPRPGVKLDPVHHTVYPRHYTVWSLSRGLRFGQFHLHAGWAIETHSVAFVAAYTVGKFVVMGFHPVTGQLQMLVGMTADTKQTID
jgi:hypothetical protein